MDAKKVEEMSSNKPRVAYLDYLRFLATVGVVIIHVTLSFTHFNKGEIDERWEIVNVVESFVRWSVPIFVMISGVSFISLKREMSLKELYSKYIWRLFLVYVCWNAFYYLCAYGAAYLRHDASPFLTDLFYPHGHLWFLPMMIGVYMVMPFMRAINEKYWGGYFLMLWSVCMSVVHIIGSEVLHPLQLTLILGYPGYFLLGNYLHLYKRANCIKPIVGVAVLVLCGAMIALLTRYCTGGEIIRVKYYDYITPLVAISSVGVFMLVKSTSVDSWTGRTMDWLLKYTRKDLFGVYLIHLFWIDLIPHIHAVDRIIHANVFIGIPCMVIVIFLLSLFSTKLLRVIPLINKIV